MTFGAMTLRNGTHVFERETTKTCDWHQCTRLASVEVRTDLPRGDSFTTLMWWRCGDHNPANWEG